VIVGTIAIVAVMIVIGVVVDRKLGIRPEQLAARPARPLITTHEIGEAPATALRATEAQLAKIRVKLMCKACRSILEADGSDHEVRYGGEALRVLGFRCPQCATRRPLYLRRAAPKA
jgi:hypothetical protein